MQRYSIIKDKDPREIVLLKAKPCIWGKCSFCDYIDDNTTDEKEIFDTNKEVLDMVEGRYQKLEVINSGSSFELGKETLDYIKQVAIKKNIQSLVFEIFLSYKNRFQEIKDFFSPIDVQIKTGIETFDDDFRKNVLNKPIHLGDIDKLADEVDVICLMVGIKSQTKDMIRRDIELSKKFKRVAINIYRNNSTHIKRDDDLVHWFVDEYKDLINDPSYDILIEPTDFGVGD